MPNSADSASPALVLTGGLVVDGTGAPTVAADVRIEGGIITAIGAGLTRGADTIDCRGRVVAPGFIDIHCHSDLTALEHPANTSRVGQGVTTEVVGNCGMTPAPAGGDPAGLRTVIGTIDPTAHEPWEWDTLAEWTAVLEAAPRATDLGTLLGHGSARYAVARDSDQPLDAAGIDRLVGLVDEALDLGYAGVSLGLMYAPGENAADDELEAVAHAVARRGAVLSAHLRSYHPDGLLPSVQAFAELAARTGCRAQISHLRMVGFGTDFAAVVDYLDGMRAHTDIAADAYPYTAGHTNLIQLLPPELRSRGARRITAVLREDPAAGALALEAGGSLLEDITLMKVPSRPQLAGRRGDTLDGGWDLLVELLIENDCLVDVAVEGSFDADLDLTYSVPWISVASDGMGLDRSHTASVPHPRSFGAFPRAYRRMRALGRPIEEAVYRMTGQPGSRVAVPSILAPGARADVVVFDDATFADTATFADPWSTAVGLDRVIVGGETVFASGVETGARPGRFIRAGR
jgi:N-acyl-D-aspartate/D-glutamate deacylase